MKEILFFIKNKILFEFELEKNDNKKVIIKKIGVIFLVVMLILTFFSNTFMSITLPEVTVKSVENGNIYSKVRGSGVVTSLHEYEIILEDNKKINEVKVNIGDVVSQNQVLFTCNNIDNLELENKEKELENLELDYQKSLLELGNKYGLYDIKIKQANEELTLAIAQSKEIESKKGVIASIENEIKAQINGTDVIQLQITNLEKVREKYGVVKETTEMENSVEQLNRDLEQLNIKLSDLNIDLQTAQLQNETDKVVNIEREIRDTTNNINYKLSDINTLQESIKEIENNNSKIIGYDNQIKDLKVQLETKNNELLNKKQQLEIEKASYEKLDEVKKLVVEKELSLKTLLSEQEQKQLDFKALDKEINELDKEIVENKKEEKSNIVAPVSGVISSINFKAGDSVEKGNVIATIKILGEGYQVSFPVSKKQSEYVKVGDKATLLNVWDNNVVAILKTISLNPEDPEKSKILTFILNGEAVEISQNVSISVGENQTLYETIVPNNSIYEDNEGSFVFALEIKKTPLGERYSVKKIRIEIVASDDYNTAIISMLTREDYVIVESMKPLENNEKVRLVN